MTTHDRTQNAEEQSHAASEGAETLRDRAATVADAAQDKLQEVAGEAEEQARRAAHVAEEEARQMATERKSQLAGQLDSVANAFRSSGQQLRTQQQGAAVANYVERAADEVNQLSHYLSNHSVDEMLADAEDFARRQPQLFLGGAFALGVLAARFFKSSSQPPQHSLMQGDDYQQGRPQQSYGMQRSPRPLTSSQTARERTYPTDRGQEW
jgi:glucan phosphorylase